MQMLWIDNPDIKIVVLKHLVTMGGKNEADLNPKTTSHILTQKMWFFLLEDVVKNSEVAVT